MNNFKIKKEEIKTHTGFGYNYNYDITLNSLS